MSSCCSASRSRGGPLRDLRGPQLDGPGAPALPLGSSPRRAASSARRRVEADPFAGVAKDPARYLVTFLEKKPPASWLAAIDPETYAPEQAAVVGNEVYLWLPAGVHDGELARVITDKKLGGFRPAATGTWCASWPRWQLE